MGMDYKGHMSQLTQISCWPDVLTHARSIQSKHMRELFAEHPKRFEQMSLEEGELFLDYSKQSIIPQSLSLLVRCLEEQNFTLQRKALFSGEKINSSENRPALHMTLRSFNAAGLYYQEVQRERERCLEFAQKLRARLILGATGKVIRNLIHVGIGGSDLGPKLLCTALADAQSPHIVFIRNVDAGPIEKAMAGLDPQETMVLVASKTFTTAETILNANSLLAWLSTAMGREKALHHMVALTAAPEKTRAYGIKDEHIFRFWDWVGGRFSVWSSIGLTAMAAMGDKAFMQLLRGAEAMDNHFVAAPLLQNMPVLLAMLSIWNINVLGYASRAVLPYCEALCEWPSYLQQLEMESLGKRVDRDGAFVPYATAPVVFGMTGTPAQHAFMQALHQGTQIIPAEIIIIKNSGVHLAGHQAMLNANALAQAQALQDGKTIDEVKKENVISQALAQQKTFSGNRPSSMMVLNSLSAYALGQLLALYEHKVFTESVFWNLNPFDQWGVELGKTLAMPIQNALETDNVVHSNVSTAGLIKRLRNL